ncbi:hypothetical protein [Desulfoscipio geothermicus]|uniref:Putative transposase n=1 Tax=Desulfoscipio geothermicus DSM 3669 TaxID=1121426 RepID=A0A1I6EK57_9FIRM|nr:hypothetical protein [Desulfoscipio geothermicus]SFR18065.1 putative transposase [Desulfoscipio geothermicus DSM 3669]
MSKCKNNQAKKTKSKDVDTLVEKFPLHLTNKQITLARNLQREAAKVWNAACTVHRTIYIKHHCWLGEGAIKAFVKGKFGIHSQSAQAVVETYFEACERTKALRKQGYTQWRYPEEALFHRYLETAWHHPQRTGTNTIQRAWQAATQT